MQADNSIAMTQANQIRHQIQFEGYTGSTSGLAPGMLQANILILPEAYAQEFLLFCQLNLVSCPLIHVSKAGEFRLDKVGNGIDIRHHLPEYHIYENGEKTASAYSIDDIWRDDFVVFVLGCSFSFEEALLGAGLEVRNISTGRNVSMYKTNLSNQSAGRFSGNTVVSMRPFTPADAIRAIQITTRFPKAHGAPIHFGSPDAIGIHDLSQPDFGDAVDILPGEQPVFWACGVTSTVAALSAKPPICITHAPGKMLITDLTNGQLALS